MKRVTIIKNNTSTYTDFESEERLNAWLEKHIAKNTFGLPERPEMALNEESGELEATGVTLPAEYSIVIEDISAQLEQDAINSEALAFLAESDWKRQRHLSQKALEIPTSLSEAEYLAMEQECQDARNRIVK
jgi:hypothetical protein